MRAAADVRVLVVDDDDTFRHVITSELERRGLKVFSAASGREALRAAGSNGADVTLLDLRLPDMDGIDVLASLREKDPDAAVVVLTGHGTIDTAIQAIRLGAYDYLEKPCPVEKLEIAVQKAAEHGRLRARKQVLEDGYAAPDLAPNVVGRSEAFRGVLDTVSRVALTDSAALVLGETGVGKEVVATLLHAQSPRRDAPFVVVDCAALHEDLLQSELFGHEQGAFTNAVRRKHGLFEVANDGTIFLDEVGDTSLDVQAKLLRVLETGRFRRLGGTDEIAVDVRVVAATNRNLEQAIARGHFREDLFYRLATFTIEIPPLRERSEDIHALIEHFVRRFNEKFGMSRQIGEPAMEMLARYSWPGNVRELMHVVEQMIILSEGDEIGVPDLPASVRAIQDAPSPGGAGNDSPALREVQRRHILAVLERVGGNRARAARLLEISERNLYRLLKAYRDDIAG